MDADLVFKIAMVGLYVFSNLRDAIQLLDQTLAEEVFASVASVTEGPPQLEVLFICRRDTTSPVGPSHRDLVAMGGTAEHARTCRWPTRSRMTLSAL
jgi:hypothetical protein